jgi:hypothetical protein
MKRYFCNDKDSLPSGARITLTFLIILVPFIWSCNSCITPLTNEQDSIVLFEQNPYYPLKVGNVWRYQYNEYNLYPEYSRKIASYTTQELIVKDTVLLYKGQRYQCVQFSQGSYYFLHSNRREVISFNDFGAMRYAARSILIRDLLRSDDSLQMEFAEIYWNDIQRATIYAKCISTNDTVVTPAGTFQNCVVIRYPHVNLTDAIRNEMNYIYYVRGIGEVARFVKVEVTRKGVIAEEVIEEYLLSSYTLVP